MKAELADGTVVSGLRAAIWLPYAILVIPLRILLGMPVRITRRGKTIWSNR